MQGKVLLSFDVEEFDLPREHGGEISVENGARVSGEGLRKILELLNDNQVKATFFCTVNFAREQTELIQRMIEDGHEIAGHGVDHFRPAKNDAKDCKQYLDKKFRVNVVGWRQPRMQKIDYDKLSEWGYLYDSSVNPAFIPGRYNNLRVSRKPYMINKIKEIPTSVATFVRVPLFWLAMHWFPTNVYIRMAKMSIRATGYFATYFHPWEFANLKEYREVPAYIKCNSGDKLIVRLDGMIKGLKKAGCKFETYGDFFRTNDWS